MRRIRAFYSQYYYHRMSESSVPKAVMPSKAKAFNYNLEALRGIAALVVVWGHIIINNSRLDPGYAPTGVFSFVAPSHASVLLFFILSGYVISLAHKNALTKENILLYLKKRFVRIYPIYFLCLLLALVVANTNYSTTTVISHLTITEGIFAPVIRALSPAWSLTYEIVFYLLFIPISFFHIKPILALFISVAIGLCSICFYPSFSFPVLASYGFGFAFWLFGLILSNYFRTKIPEFKYSSILSLLFLFLIIEKFDGVVTIFNRTVVAIFNYDLSQLTIGQVGAVALRDFVYLPYCLLIIIEFSGHKFKYHQAIKIILMLLPASTFYAYYKHIDSLLLLPLVLPILFYGLSWLLFMFSTKTENISRWLIKKLILTGSISYALYILHFPILYKIGSIQEFSGSSYTFWLRLIYFLTLAISGAWILEVKFQPWVKKIFFPAQSD